MDRERERKKRGEGRSFSPLQSESQGSASHFRDPVELEIQFGQSGVGLQRGRECDSALVLDERAR
jgi:hypothetical protein